MKHSPSRRRKSAPPALQTKECPAHPTAVGTAFFPLTYGSESGIFSTLSLPSLPPREAWEYAYESTDFKLWITSVPEPSSLVLLGGGLLGIAGMLRRKLF